MAIYKALKLTNTDTVDMVKLSKKAALTYPAWMTANIVKAIRPISPDSLVLSVK